MCSFYAQAKKTWCVKVILSSFFCYLEWLQCQMLPCVTSLPFRLVLAASENTAIPVLAKHQHTLSGTYVHLTPLSDVWHFSSITVMTDPSLSRGVARSNMEKIHQSNNTTVIDRRDKDMNYTTDWIIVSVRTHFIYYDTKVLGVPFLLLWLVSVCILNILRQFSNPLVSVNSWCPQILCNWSLRDTENHSMISGWKLQNRCPGP